MATLAVRRSDLAATVPMPDPPAIGDGEVRVAVEAFALTANNVTYAVHGDDFAYWQFWPAADGALGIVPVWGFGRVVESRAAGIDLGTRLFGYWPMAAQAVLRPVAVSAHGFADGAPHRAALPPFYNRYTPASSDWGDEALQCLFRPLYATSFLIAAMLEGRAVDTVLMSSASSKTALGLARALGGRVRVVGLTSPANIDFCRATGYFDQVLGYDDVGAVNGESIAFVDFAGNGAVRLAVHAGLGDRLVESHIVGDTHWQAPNTQPLPGPVPQLFFAPSVGQARVAQWGQAGYEARLAAAWADFAGTLGWLRIERPVGADSVAAAWAGLVAGRIDPAAGIIARL